MKWLLRLFGIKPKAKNQQFNDFKASKEVISEEKISESSATNLINEDTTNAVELEASETKLAVKNKTNIVNSPSETAMVTKKQYEQISKANILEKLYPLFKETSKKEVKLIIDSAFEIITDKLAINEEVSINGFGKFERADKPAREGVNPMSGQAIEIKATNSAKFKPAKTLKEKMSNTTWTGLYQVEKNA